MLSPLHRSFNEISEIPLSDWEAFEQCLTRKSYKKGAYFLKCRQVSSRIGFVEKGIFRLYHQTDRKEVNYNFFAERQFVVDYESFLKDEPSEFFIEALQDSVVHVVDKKELYKLFARSHAWERFGRVTAERIFLKSRERIKQFMLLPAEQRYRALIREKPYLLDRVPLYHIASYIGIDATSLSRIRRDFTRKGIS